MKIIITGRKCTPRDSFKEHAEKKLQKVERFFDDSAEAKVTATVEKSCQIVEVTVATRGMIFRSEERAQNMNEALDKCVDSLIRQIRKNKTRLEKRLREGSLDSVIIASEPEEEELDFNVVRTKHVSVKPQSVDEAILQMNLLDHQFYLFRNAETDEVNVVYKRQDGGYGVIVPEAE
ncbi:MAG: ribosome-associated translation inhibitor RaiA [Oscillospiraceae bacterium]|nr:ribosome-associated translation inhibitor RaiA [Oscillospiraceae bacterium]